MLGEKELANLIKTIGLYNRKAKTIISLCKILVLSYYAKIPSTRNELEKLPGVGRKTASIVLNEVFEKNYIAVDRHVFRVSKRLGLSKSTSVINLERDLEKKIPEEFKKFASLLLILHGRQTCQSKNPLCKNCILIKFCDLWNNEKYFSTESKL